MIQPVIETIVKKNHVGKKQRKPEKQVLLTSSCLAKEAQPAIETIVKKNLTQNKQQEIEKQVLQKVDQEQIKSCTFNIARVTNNTTQEVLILKMVETEALGKSLITINNKVVGKWREWTDDYDEFQEDIKDKDGRVLDPSTSEPLYEFVVTHDFKLTPKTYREYKYLSDQGVLQWSNEIEYLDPDDEL